MVVNVSCAVIARFVTTGHVFLTPFVGVPTWMQPESLRMDFLLFMLIPWTFAIVGLISEYWYGIREKAMTEELAELVQKLMVLVQLLGLLVASLLSPVALVLSLVALVLYQAASWIKRRVARLWKYLVRNCRSKGTPDATPTAELSGSPSY